MGWRFRRSIGGKYFRVNLGKHGVNSVTFGARGMPHVTTGRTGTRVGASIPGTGIYYTHKIGEAASKASSDAPITQHIDAAPTTSFPVQPQTAVLPPPGDGTPANTGKHGNNHPLPWSRLALSALILGLLALACFAFNGYTAAMLFSLAAIPLGIAGLIVIQLRKSRRSALLAVCAIILSMSMLVASAINMPTAQSTASSSTNSISANQKAARLAKQKAARQQKLADEQAKETKEKLDAAKGALTSKLGDARKLLDDSDGQVADQTTRDALGAAIDTASAMNSTMPDDWTSAIEPLQSAMDAVTASETKKQQDDAAAAAAAAAQASAKAKADADAAAKPEAEQRQQTQQNTQQQTQQQSSSGSLVAVCSDGTRSYSSPGASDYRGMCSHHHGIAQKLGRQ